jgi:hypothetical protein
LFAKRITAKSLAKKLTLLLFATLLTSCETTRQIATTGPVPPSVTVFSNKQRVQAAQKARCSGWRKISFSAKGDTDETIGEIRSHNQTGVNKRCWTPKDRPRKPITTSALSLTELDRAALRGIIAALDADRPATFAERWPS